jgi:diguanylate cyclase (GGDEF)-like protein
MPTSRRPVPVAYVGLSLLYVAMLAVSAAALRTGFLPYVGVAEFARVVFGAIGLLAANRASRSPKLAPRARNAWRAMAVSFAVLVVTPALLMLLDAHGFSAADDVTHVAFVVSVLVALQLFPLAPTNRRARWKTALDALTVLVGGSMVLWYTSFGPYVNQHGPSVTVLMTSAVYPIVDLALLFSVARVLLRGADASARRPLRPLAAGILILFAGDAVHGYLRGHAQVELHSPWQFVCWITADALLAIAAIEQCRMTERAARERLRRFGAARYLPFGAVAVAHILMLAAVVEDGSFYPWGGLALGGALLSAIVLIRQNLVQHESDERAVTDGLTGLANRIRFRETAQRAVTRGARSGRHTAIMVLDMNSFKQVNDTLGHKSGDLVLVKFAEVLRGRIPHAGLLARVGGDEFAVLLPDLDDPHHAYEVAAHITAGLTPVVIEDKLIAISASIGVAVSAPGELSYDDIVHRADLAMYQAKQDGPDARWMAWHHSLGQRSHADHLTPAA